MVGKPVLCVVLGVWLVLGGCDGPDQDHDQDVRQEEVENKRDDEQDEEHAGEKHSLGTVASGTLALAVTRVGDVEEGAESIFEVRVTKGGDQVRTIRGWVGRRNAKGSVKMEAAREKDGYDLRTKVPARPTADAKLWIEVELKDGKYHVMGVQYIKE